jgi:t-SNARE complex subunit (syntaxin)
MKNKLKKLWDWLLNQTTLDEKISEIVEEVGERIDRVKEEVGDIIQSAKEVGKQIDDVKGAVKGQKRKGRPKKKHD